jgi:hypothetical protein
MDAVPMFARVILALNGVFVLVSGLACIVAPESLAQQAGLAAGLSALTEVRAFYGGLQVGTGCFLLWCLRRRETTFAGLLLIALGVGGAGIARALGLLIDREPTSFHLMNLGIEIVTVALVAVALAKLRRAAETDALAT